MITSAMTEYVFGVRHTFDDGERRIERIDEHVWGNIREKSGFFDLPNAENVSAVIINAQGTLPKFNRMGYLAEFGNRRMRMMRTGFARGERNPEGRDYGCPRRRSPEPAMNSFSQMARSCRLFQSFIRCSRRRKSGSSHSHMIKSAYPLIRELEARSPLIKRMNLTASIADEQIAGKLLNLANRTRTLIE